MKWLIAILSVASISAAPMSPEEAQRQLAARQAMRMAATTQPGGELDQLRAANQKLLDKIKLLNEQVTTLTAALTSKSTEATALLTERNAVRRASTPPIAKAEMTEESFKAFSQRLAPALQKGIEKLHKSDALTERTAVVSILSTDLKKSDSVVNPVVAVATFSEFTASSARDHSNSMHWNHTLTMTFGIENGRWRNESHQKVWRQFGHQ